MKMTLPLLLLIIGISWSLVYFSLIPKSIHAQSTSCAPLRLVSIAHSCSYSPESQTVSAKIYWQEDPSSSFYSVRIFTRNAQWNCNDTASGNSFCFDTDIADQRRETSIENIGTDPVAVWIHSRNSCYEWGPVPEPQNIYRFSCPATSECPLHSKGDLNCDGTVTIDDLSLWTNFIYTRNTIINRVDPFFDIDNNNQISLSDYVWWLNGFRSQ